MKSETKMAHPKVVCFCLAVICFIFIGSTLANQHGYASHHGAPLIINRGTFDGIPSTDFVGDFHQRSRRSALDISTGNETTTTTKTFSSGLNFNNNITAKVSRCGLNIEMCCMYVEESTKV